ncbi:MAG: LysM peptidoglycan-binding domain-containing protein [Aquaticitalea sp.]
MKKLILIIIIIVSSQSFAIAQNYRTHTVKQGETVESIAQQYQVTTSEILTLNPDTNKKLNAGDTLIIPKSGSSSKAVASEIRQLIGYDTHRVKRKETLYSIAKEYHIEIADIKESNKQLYSDNLKKGDKIRIPKYKTVVSKVSSVNNSLKKYKVQPKEGKWRVAYKYGLTVPELEALNPNMPEILQPGDEINVPNVEVTEENATEGNYNYYEVLPKEGFYRLKIKLGLTQEQLETLNPELKVSGLKEGMVIKLPQGISVGKVEGNVENTNLSSSLKNLETKRIAIMMPFRLNKIDVDSVQETKDIMKNDKLISVTLDFYAGARMALDSAKQLGISTYLKVFDTENQISEVSKILSDNDFSQFDAVIGPLMTANFDRVAASLKSDNIPVVSPMMKPSTSYDNVFQTIPSEEFLEKAMIDYVKVDSLRSNVIIISDSGSHIISDRLKSEFPNATQVFSKKGKEGKDAYYISAGDVSSALRSGKNYVFLQTTNAGLVLNVVSSLNSMTNKDKEVILVTTDKNDAYEYEHLSNYHLSNLKFHYPSVNKPLNSDNPTGFVKQYRATYGVDPNKYAVRGFDLTLDVLLRLASADDFYKASTNDVETQYIENKFRYAKKMAGGYYNESVYILQYTPDLTIEEAKR